MLLMQYVRKKAKRVLPQCADRWPSEGDAATYRHAGRSQLELVTARSVINFCKTLRTAGAAVDHVFVFFFYDIFPDSKKVLGDLGVTLHSLATRRARRREEKAVRSILRTSW